MAKSSIYDRYEQDLTVGEQGMWITDLLVPLKMHAQTSKRVRAVQADLDKKYRQALLAGGGELPFDKAEKKVTELLSRGIVSNWGKKAALADGVPAAKLPETGGEMTDRDGNELPYTVENATRVFMDLPLFRGAVLGISNSEETFRKSALEELKGNSVAPSAPISPSEETSPA